MPGSSPTTCWVPVPKARDLTNVQGAGTAAPAARIRKHSVKLSGHSTSLSLEGVYWDALREVARELGLSMNRLIEQIDRERSGNLSSAVRVFLLHHYRARALASSAEAPGPVESSNQDGA